MIHFHSRLGKLTCSPGGKKAKGFARTQLVLQRRQRRYGIPAEQLLTDRYHSAQPVVETKTRKRSGIGIQVPKRVSPSRGRSRATSWRMDSIGKRSTKQGIPHSDARFVERSLAYQDLLSRSGSDRSLSPKLGKTSSTSPSEWRRNRVRVHKAAKANRVNRTK